MVSFMTPPNLSCIALTCEYLAANLVEISKGHYSVHQLLNFLLPMLLNNGRNIAEI